MIDTQRGYGAAGDFGSPGRTISSQDPFPTRSRPDEVQACRVLVCMQWLPPLKPWSEAVLRITAVPSHHTFALRQQCRSSHPLLASPTPGEGGLHLGFHLLKPAVACYHVHPRQQAGVSMRAWPQQLVRENNIYI